MYVCSKRHLYENAACLHSSFSSSVFWMIWCGRHFLLYWANLFTSECLHTLPLFKVLHSSPHPLPCCSPRCLVRGVPLTRLLFSLLISAIFTFFHNFQDMLFCHFFHPFHSNRIFLENHITNGSKLCPSVFFISPYHVKSVRHTGL